MATPTRQTTTAPANERKGAMLVHRVIKAITENPNFWKRTALFITHDEHGGLYDHYRPSGVRAKTAQHPTSPAEN